MINRLIAIIRKAVIRLRWWVHDHLIAAEPYLAEAYDEAQDYEPDFNDLYWLNDYDGRDFNDYAHRFDGEGAGQ